MLLQYKDSFERFLITSLMEAIAHTLQVINQNYFADQVYPTSDSEEVSQMIVFEHAEE